MTESVERWEGWAIVGVCSCVRMRAAVTPSLWMTCPSCDSERVYPSRLRNTVERLRHRLTDRQPYRCHDCVWRRWQQMAFIAPNPDVSPDDLRVGRRPAPWSRTTSRVWIPGIGRVPWLQSRIPIRSNPGQTVDLASRTANRAPAPGDG